LFIEGAFEILKKKPFSCLKKNKRETNSTKLAHSFFSKLGLFTIPNGGPSS
jgi:hypothetical protein